MMTHMSEWRINSQSELDINNPSTCEIPPKVSTGGDARMPGLLRSLDLTGQWCSLLNTITSNLNVRTGLAFDLVDPSHFTSNLQSWLVQDILQGLAFDLVDPSHFNSNLQSWWVQDILQGLAFDLVDPSHFTSNLQSWWVQDILHLICRVGESMLNVPWSI